MRFRGEFRIDLDLICRKIEHPIAIDRYKQFRLKQRGSKKRRGFSPMHRLLSTILAVSVMLHATLGCCFHHAHSCEINCCDVPAATSNSCSCDSHHHDGQWTLRHAAKSEIAPHNKHSEPRGEHQCEGESCSFTTTEDSPQFELTAFQNLACAFDLLTRALQAASDGLSLIKPAAPNDACSNLRLHLLLGVLLI